MGRHARSNESPKALARRRRVCARGERQTTAYVHKTTGGLDITAEVHRAASDPLRPVLVWIHGGTLIMGHREGISDPVKRWALEAGYALVSVDYRLGPETRLAGIVGDVEDAFAWVGNEGRRLFRADTTRIAVAGFGLRLA